MHSFKASNIIYLPNSFIKETTIIKLLSTFKKMILFMKLKMKTPHFENTLYSQQHYLAVFIINEFFNY